MAGSVEDAHADSGFTALMYAAGAAGAAGSAEAAGRAEMVGWLLDNGADPNLGDSRGRVPLFEAAFYGRVDVMGLLLDGGADVDGADVWGVVPLQAAGPHYDRFSKWSFAATVVGYLLSRGAEVNARDIWGRSPLDVYAEWSHRNVAAVLRNAGGKCFVQTGPLCGVDVAVGFSSSGSGTVSAAGDGDALSDGDEVRQGATVMFTATPAAGHYVSGWSGNCADAGGVADGLDGTAKSCSVLADSDLSVRAEFSEIPSLAGPLCPSGSLSANGLTQAELDAGLVSAAQANNLEDVCEHLRRGASVEAQEQSGTYRRTALMIAAYDRYLDLAKLLHANGADVNSRVGNGGGGGTAWPGRWNTHADTGFSALMYAAGAAGAAGSAAAAGRAEMVGWLLDNGADPNLGDSRGRLPLWEAAHYGRVDVMGLLLDGGADVDGADVWGVVPLQAAGPHYDRFSKWSFAATVVGYLLSRGAEVNARDIWGRSPLDVYAEWSHRNVAAVLRNAGGKCFVQTGPLCGVDVAVGFSSSGSGTVSAAGDGDALSDGDEVRQGATVMFTATPAAGHYVSGWSGNCADAGGVADGLDGTAKSCSVLADSDLSVRAEFSEIPSLAGPLCPSGSLSANGLTTAELNMTLRLAARGGDAARACEALRRGAAVNDNLDNSEFTPLQEAVSGGHLEAVKILLANGAEVNKRKDSAGRSPLDLAARDSEAEIAALLREADGECFLETGPLCGSVPVATPDLVTVVNTVAATVANTVAATVANTVAATVASIVASTLAADYSCSADSFAGERWSQEFADSELRFAAKYVAVDLIYGLGRACKALRHGANVNGRSRSMEYTPLHFATEDLSVEMAKLLISHGADVNANAGSSVTPLHVAVDEKDDVYGTIGNVHDAMKNMVKLLLDNGADVNANGGGGWTPLHYAVFSNDPKIAELLLEHGADVGATTDENERGGETPLDVARRMGRLGWVNADMVAFLEAAEESAGNPPVAAAAPAQADALAGALRGRFAGAFNPSPAFGDAFGAVSGSSERFLGRLDSLMRSSAVSGGNAWDSFAGWQRENEHGRMWFSTGQRGDFGFGAGGNGAGGDLSASPFAALVGNGMLAGGETGLGSDGKLRIAAFADYQAKSLLDGTDREWTNWAARGTAIETAMTEAERFSGLSENRTRGAMTELHLGGGDLGVALQAGAVSESDSVLSGTAGNENLRGLNSRTAFAGLSGAANLFGSGWRLRGSAHLGRSWAESEGMLRSSDLWASAFSAGLERGGWLYSDDGFVLRFSQPLRVENWDMELIGDDGAGRLGADASGRQLDVDAAYRLPLSGGGWLLLSAGVRRDGGHSSSSDLEAGALFSVERGF